MDLILCLNNEIANKKEKFEKELFLLSSLSDCIEKKENFSKVWHSLLKCDITNSDLAQELVAYYFDIDKSKIYITPGRVIIRYGLGLSLELYFGNIVFTPNIVQKDISSTFLVEVKLPFKWSHIIEEKKPFRKTEFYEISEKYIELKERNASFNEILEFRYEGLPKHRQYYNYFLQGHKIEKDISYYREYLEKEHKKYQEYCDTWDKDTANALTEFLEFYGDIYPIIQKNLNLEYSRVKYNIKFEEIVSKLKGMGEII